MKHYDYEISRFVEDELPETEKIKLQQHLSVCEQCRQTLSDYREIRDNIKQFYNTFPKETGKRADKKNIYTLKLKRDNRRINVRRLYIPFSIAASVILALTIFLYLNPAGVNRVKIANSNIPVEKELKHPFSDTPGKPQPQVVINNNVVKKNHSINSRVKNARHRKENISTDHPGYNIAIFNEVIDKAIAERRDSLKIITDLLSLGRDFIPAGINSAIDSTLIKLKVDIYN